jgi:hypothetical protein
MARIADAAGRLATLERLLNGLVRLLRRLAIAAAIAVIPVVLVLREDGFEGLDAVVVVALLVPSAIVLFFAQGLRELTGFPDRLRRIPGEGQERLAEIARVGSEMRGARLRRTPLVLWRLRGAVGSARDVAGIALPLRVLTPAFLGLAALASVGCVVVCLVGLTALLWLA